MSRILWTVLLLLYVVVVTPLSDHLRSRPIAVKLGYTPDADVLKIISADHRETVAELTVLKVLFYYGTLIEKWRQNVMVRPEHYNMFKTVETAVRLDPYNMDAFYLMQAAFTWELGRAADVNRVLEYGMDYRTWDWQLPFYVGFNSAYFLQDYEKAAAYMKRAAELSGNPLFTRLAARFFHQAGRDDLGIMFLNAMIEGTRDPQLRQAFEIRRDALLGVKKLREAVALFRKRTGRMPSDLGVLVSEGILQDLPVDPYGGEFYLAEDGRVQTTSEFVLSEEGGGDKME